MKQSSVTHDDVKFDIPNPVTMRSTILWDVALCSLVEVHLTC
jgi:hypothetical protein